MRRSIFYSALLLTGVNLLLRLTGTVFQIYVSRRIGAEGVGLVQLIMSVGGLALVAGTAGVRTAAMYLSAQKIGQNQHRAISGILTCCLIYSILCSGIIALGFYHLAPMIGTKWIGNPAASNALRLMAGCLPAVCLCSVLSGYLTAANRIQALAAVEIGEQAAAMSISIVLLQLWAGNSTERICLSLAAGSCFSGCAALIAMGKLSLVSQAPRTGIRPWNTLFATAVPLAAADLLRSGIGTIENLMVPRRLALFPGAGNPLASFGIMSGMVFPVLMFPAAILFGLSELLIPEFARCHSAGMQKRISYLSVKTLHIGFLYGCAWAGILYLCGDYLCNFFYRNKEAGFYLRLFTFMVPFLYADAVVDAMTKGLGQQKICVRYNIVTGFLDVVFLFLLLPELGMKGYFISFTGTHLLNFFLSLNRLVAITNIKFSLMRGTGALSAAAAAVWAGTWIPSLWLRAAGFLGIWGCLLVLMGITGKSDLIWLWGLIKKGGPQKQTASKKAITETSELPGGNSMSAL